MTVESDILALERAALIRWCSGDPTGFLEISAEEVVYFDPFIPARIDGREALAAYYAPSAGKIFAPRFEILDPRVQVLGEAAVLTFRFNSYSGSEGAEMRWNCTEVYARKPEGWRIVQTHWSFTEGGK